jgi:branched-chain amino acid transport system substrate-binding protein
VADEQVERAEREALLARLTRPIDRREFMRLTAMGAGSAAIAAFLAACGVTASPSASALASAGASAGASTGPIGRHLKIGYVTPTTGPFSAFAEADEFVLGGVKSAIGAGIANGGTTYPIDILVKDSAGDPTQAGEAALSLIQDDGIDLMLVASTPETTNPVSGACEANGVPCISTVTPWQPYLLRDPNVAPPDTQPFAWSYHFFWGLEDIIAVFTDMWSQITTNKIVGGLWPNDGDGQAWSSPVVGFPPTLTAGGYTLISPALYENIVTTDFSSQISKFKDGHAQILTGVPLPPDFTNFWQQAAQQGFKPKAASVGKALLFPASVDALGPDLGIGLSAEVWWSPNHPFHSSLTGASAKELADGYTTATTKQWTQPIGFAHAVFEVGLNALKSASSIDDKGAIRDAIKATALDTVVGHVEWNGANLPPFAAVNVAKTPLVGGQWVKGTGSFDYDLVIVSNKDQPTIPAAGKLQPIPGS